MICRIVAVALIVCAATATAARANPSLTPQEALEQGRVAYERGEYAQVVQTIRPLLYPRNELGTEDSIVRARRLLALSYLFMKKEHEAEDEVNHLLEIRPSFELDKFVDPPVAVRFFDDVRRRQEERLHALRERQRQEEERRRREEERRREEARARARVFVETTVQHNSRLIAALPFGIGQLQNGQRKKAIAFAVTEGLLGAASLSLWIGVRERFPGGHVQLDPMNRIDERPLAQALSSAQLATGVLFWATVAWGIIDAQVLFKSERPLRTREVPQKTKVTLSPLVSPNFFGIEGKF
jgi:hypothetical protein